MKLSLKIFFWFWVLCMIYLLNNLSTSPFTSPYTIVRYLTLLTRHFIPEPLLLLVSVTSDEPYFLFPTLTHCFASTVGSTFSSHTFLVCNSQWRLAPETPHFFSFFSYLFLFLPPFRPASHRHVFAHGIS